ncbi:Transcription factor MYB23 [Porphyridium purpureum]|uniref:Transcription factor MYB23 n=1 Tax=Porphyridium purpureum TaxID=35688 RepID=A0A5J4Z7K5_PORPP|nr:Transcription factor MYB23 [Porphyridium purpureum]|eukprot:POR1418..scf295_1
MSSLTLHRRVPRAVAAMERRPPGPPGRMPPFGDAPKRSESRQVESAQSSRFLEAPAQDVAPWQNMPMSVQMPKRVRGHELNAGAELGLASSGRRMHDQRHQGDFDRRVQKTQRLTAESAPASVPAREVVVDKMSLDYILNPSPGSFDSSAPGSSSSLPNRSEIGRRMWTTEEDDILRTAVSLHGAQNWEALAQEYLPSRSARQLRARWAYYLGRTETRPTEFTEEQDTLILSLADEAIQNRRPIKWGAMVHRVGGGFNGQELKFRHRKLVRRLKRDSLSPSSSPAAPPAAPPQ